MYPPAHLVRANSSRQRDLACCITDPPDHHDQDDDQDDDHDNDDDEDDDDLKYILSEYCFVFDIFER